MHIRVVAAEWLPWVQVEVRGGNIVINGPMSTLLNWLASSLNFTYSIRTPPDHQWGVRHPDGSWSGMIGMLRRNEADLGLGPFGLNLDRFEDVRPTLPLNIDSTGILVRAADWEMSIFSAFQGFSSEVWLSLLILIFLTSFSAAVIDKFHSSTKLKFVCSFPRQVWQFSRTILNQENESTPRHVDRCILKASWIISILVLTVSFSSNFLATLMVQRVTQIQSLEDLCRNSQLQPVVESGSSVHSFFMEDKSDVGRELLRRLEARPNEALKSSIEMTSHDVLDKVSNGSCALIMEALTLKSALSQRYAERGTCNFHLAEMKVFSNIQVMLFRNDFPQTVLEKVNEILWRVAEGRLLLPKIDRMIFNSSRCLNKESSKRNPLNLANLQGVFALWAAGCILSLFIFVCERRCSVQEGGKEQLIEKRREK